MRQRSRIVKTVPTTMTTTKTFRFVNRHTGETRIVGGLRDLAHAWNISRTYAAALGWNIIDLHIRAES